jgi:hypothetical protein
MALGKPDGTPRWCKSSERLFSVHLEKVLVSAQGRCTFCAERSIGSEIILTHPMVLLGDVGQVEACFSPFGDSVNLCTR